MYRTILGDFGRDMDALYSNVHFYSNVTHTTPPKVHGCVNLKRTTQIRWKEQTFKVRLRFMFHYCIFLERRLLSAAYLRGSATPKAQPSAATKARTKTNKADYPRPMRLQSVVRLYSRRFVLCRGCSPLLSRNRSCALAILPVDLAFFYCNVHFKS